jgi:hypothetical protein
LISSAEFELARAARENIDHARALLLSPTLKSLIAVTPALEESATILARLEDHVKGVGHEDLASRQKLRQELRGLRQSLNGLERLMENAAAFHSGWAGLIGVSAAVYTRTGEPGLASAAGTMAVRG